MLRLLQFKFRIDFIVNPFFLYPLSFAIALFLYLWGWSDLYPRLSVWLIIYFFISFGLFIAIGSFFSRRKLSIKCDNSTVLNDILFWIIIILGFSNIILEGYLPILDRTKNYREFGAPVIDPVFNTLCIFFSISFLQSFLAGKKKKMLIYYLVILAFQIFIFRRSTIVWILLSSIFLLILNSKRVSLKLIIVSLICIPFFSYCFGMYGNYRSKLSREFLINGLNASESFKRTGLSPNIYITYLYLSSPLANLQENIDNGTDFMNKNSLRTFFVNNILPETIKNKVGEKFNTAPVTVRLIHPELIVGTYLMLGFCTLGWTGMICMSLFLMAFIYLCLYFSNKWNTFQVVTYCLLSTTVALLIFSNFLNRLDVIIMLFIYPLLFHFIYSGTRLNKPISAEC